MKDNKKANDNENNNNCSQSRCTTLVTCRTVSVLK